MDNKKLTVNSIASSIIKNSLWFLVSFGVIFACFLPFIKITATMELSTASVYSGAIAGISVLIRTNSYTRYFLEYQRYKSYIVNALLYGKYKENIYLEDVQRWIEGEDEKLKQKFLRDASYYLGVKPEQDGSIDLKKFYPQEPDLPNKLSKRATQEQKLAYEKAMEKYNEELSEYKNKKKRFRISWVQKRYIKRIKNKKYPKIPWTPSAILNVVGDADIYINKNVFKQESIHKKVTMIMWLLFSVVGLFIAGSLVFGYAGGGWTMALQSLVALFSIISSVIIGAVQGNKGGKLEERSLITANGIFKQIRPQTIDESDIEKYIKENQIVVVYSDSGEKVKVDVDEIVKMATARIEEKFEVVSDEEEKGK